MKKAFGVRRSREVLVQLAGVITRPLKHLGRCREIREVPRSSEKANIKPIFKKGKKEDWECCKLVSFISLPGKVTGHMHLQPPPSLVGQKRIAEPMWEGNKGHAVCLDFCTSLDVLSHSLLRAGC